MFTKTVRHGLLLDFYGPLLTEKQRRVLAGYLEEDLSLGEIAEERGVSRAAVHDLVRRALAVLEGYEEKLGLVARYGGDRQRLKTLLSRVEAALSAGSGERTALEEVAGFLRTALDKGEWPLD